MPTYHQSYTFNHKSRLNLQPSQKVTKGSKIISMGLWGGGLNHLEEMFDYFCAVMKVDESVLKQKRNGLSKDIFNKAIFDYMVESMTTHQEGSLLANKFTSGNFRECHSFHPFFKTNIFNLCKSLHEHDLSPEKYPQQISSLSATSSKSLIRRIMLSGKYDPQKIKKAERILSCIFPSQDR